MTDRNEVQQEFDAFGKSLGMVKHSGNWYRSSPEVISLLNLQKSQYGRSYYINIGFWITALEQEQFPKEHKCHVRIRLGSLVPDRADEIAALLDLERDVPDRIERLHDILERDVRPLLDRGKSLQGLRQLRSEGRLARAHIWGPAVTHLRAA